jgi:hypothetical protein
VIVDDVAKMLAIDTLIAHKGLTEDEKAQDITKNEKLSFMLGEAQEHYKMELYGLCEVWNKKIDAWIS